MANDDLQIYSNFRCIYGQAIFFSLFLILTARARNYRFIDFISASQIYGFWGGKVKKHFLLKKSGNKKRYRKRNKEGRRKVVTSIGLVLILAWKIEEQEKWRRINGASREYRLDKRPRLWLKLLCLCSACTRRFVLMDNGVMRYDGTLSSKYSSSRGGSVVRNSELVANRSCALAQYSIYMAAVTVMATASTLVFLSVPCQDSWFSRFCLLSRFVHGQFANVQANFFGFSFHPL